jgi:anti-sigma factor RsiW
MKMTNELLMDYLDGRLDETRRGAVEAHLQTNAEDAALLADIKASQAMLQEWDAAEPVRASDDFWIKVREQLPEKPGSNPLRALGQNVMAWLWPQNARTGLPVRVAAMALFAAMAFALFSPRDATHTAQAEISPADRTFIQQSMNRHQAYLSTQPLSSFDTRGGDGRDGDGDGDDSEGDDDYTP